ncbi:VWA domain-containing protein [uncultured Anaerococcus sp.]|uniref:DUF7604 domain-containing protein n=1 Tax=uncultured Anaerococcus sp. TaxID=293428 RepID=UPI0026360C58|nr:VWA domain-containing protein [uncultured Anaerococcus sp.]
MKKRISKIFSIFLALVMLVSNSPFALAKACNESVFPKAYNHASMKKCVSQSLLRKNHLNNNLLLASNQLDSNQSDPNIYNGESENEDNPSNENLEDTEKASLSKEDVKLIDKYKAILANKSYNLIEKEDEGEKTSKSEDQGEDKKLKIIKAKNENEYTNLVANKNEKYKGYQDLVLEARDDKRIDEINLYANEKLEVVKNLFTEEEIDRIQDILSRLEVYLGENEKEDNIEEIQSLLEELRRIKGSYSLEDESLTIKDESFDEDEKLRHLTLTNKNPENKKIRLLIKIKKDNEENEAPLLRFAVKNTSEEDNFALFLQKDKPKARSLEAIAYKDDVPAKDTKKENVARSSFLRSARVAKSHSSHHDHYKDIKVIKSWKGGNEAHDPIEVKLFKNYTVRIRYYNHRGRKKTRDIEIKNLYTDSIELSESIDWKGRFKDIPDEHSQERIIEDYYRDDKNHLIEDAGGAFPEDIPEDFKIKEIYNFTYSISEVKVKGYKSNIKKSTDNHYKHESDIYYITNTKEHNEPEEPEVPEVPDTLKPKITVHEQIDYLGDNVKNQDTDIQEDQKYKNQLEDIYRLYLDVEGERLKKNEAVDLLFVLDGSSSMKKEDMSWNGEAMSRKDAMLGMINNTDLVENFLKQNDQNRVAFLYFNGYTRNENTKREDGYTYHEDAKTIKGWSHSLDSKIDFDFKAEHRGTNYQAGLMMAEELLRKSEEQKGRRQVMIFISDGVPTFWIDSDGNRREDGRNSSKTVRNSKIYTKEFLDGFYRRHPNLITHAVGVSEDINEDSLSESKSPEVLKYMADKGKGSYIGVKSNTGELVSKLKYAIEAAVTEVRIEDPLSDRVELLADKADFKVVKVNKDTGEETILWENGNETLQNGDGSNRCINSLVYDKSNKKVVLTFNPNYKLEGNTKYVLSYNIKTNKKAQEDYQKNGYDAKGDMDTDYKGNDTSSGKSGFSANKNSVVYYKGGEKSFPHPVVQVKAPPSRELPTTGGEGTKIIKAVGGIVFLGAGFALIRKKRNV